MFPIRDDNLTLRAPLATFVLIGLNLLAWIFVQGLGTSPALAASVCNFGLIPGEVLGRIPPGTSFPLAENLVCQVGTSAGWWTAVTSMFLHGSWFHLIGNMWFLWVFGNNVEDVTGRFRFILFYLLCGLGAVAAQMLSAPDSVIPMVGASGAIGGVMGAYAVLFPRVRVATLLILGFFFRMIDVPAIVMLGFWFLLQLVMGLPSIGREVGGVAFWAHVGGFLAGLVLVFLFRNPRLVAAHRRATGAGVEHGILGRG